MTAALEQAAKEWLSDPSWVKVFKNSFDVLEDQINKGLVAVAGFALAVRFLANLPTGDLLCIVVGVEGNLTFDTMAGPMAQSLANYAAQDPTCQEAVFYSPNMTGFMMYGPFLMMSQALILIAIEKITLFFPRLNQKLHQSDSFYAFLV